MVDGTVYSLEPGVGNSLGPINVKVDAQKHEPFQ